MVLSILPDDVVVDKTFFNKSKHSEDDNNNITYLFMNDLSICEINRKCCRAGDRRLYLIKYNTTIFTN